MKIAIIGAGVAGISMLSAIVTYYSEGKYYSHVEVTIFEGKEIGGVPYQIKSEACLLNLPASIMSIDVTKPDHFKDWLFQKGIPEYSIPRYIYGQYLREVYIDLLSSNHDFLSFKEIREDAIKITRDYQKFKVHSSSGNNSFDKVILCAGHSESKHVFPLAHNKNYINNPWKFDFNQIDHRASVAIIGSRLTALDISKLLMYNGHKGKISLCTRTGNLPQVKSLVSAPVMLKYLRGDALESMKDKNGYIALDKIIELLSLELSGANCTEYIFKKNSDSKLFIVEQLQEAMESRPEQEILGALYQSKLIDYIWHYLSLEDKLYFNKYYASQWMSFAHPIPFENGIFLRDAMISKAINIHSGLYQIEEAGTQFKISAKQDFFVDYVINCTGMSKSVDDHRSELLQYLIKNKMVKTNVLGGLEQDHLNLQMVSPSGKIINGFYVTGAISCGVFFSAFAVIHAARNSFTITRNIFDDINIEARSSYEEVQKSAKIV